MSRNKKKTIIERPTQQNRTNKTIIILAAVFLIALLCRLAPLGQVFKSGDVFFFENDTYYHVMRIIHTAHNYLIPFTHDPYLDYPGGYDCFWPPLFDQMIALIALIFGFGSPGDYTIKAVSAFFPAVLGALTIFVVYLLGKETFNKKTGVLAAFLFSILPAHLFFSILGRPDHHVAEPVFSMLMFYFFLVACRKTESKDIRKSAILAGISGACALLTWIGSTVFIGLLGIFVLLQILLNSKHDEARPKLSAISLYVFIPLLIIITPYCLLSQWGRQGKLAYDALSLFQPLFISGIISLLWLSSRAGRHPVRLFLVILVFISAALFILPGFYENLKTGLQYFSKKDPWFRSIGELQPLLKPTAGFPVSFGRAESFFTKFFYVFFIGLAVFIFNFFKRREKPLNEQLFFFLVIATLLMALNQQRFVHVFAVTFAITMSYLFFRIFNPKELFALKNTAMFLLLAIFFVFPCAKYIAQTGASPFGPPPALYDTLIWMKNNTPKTSYFGKLDKKPEYSVLAPWAYGMWIECIAQRPVLASNFHNMKGNTSSARFFVSEDEDSANKILDENGVRYIITCSMLSSERLGDCMDQLGIDKSQYYDKTVIPENGQVAYIPKYKYYSLVSERLFLLDGKQVEMKGGAKPQVIKALKHYRLVYESPNYDNTVPFPIPVKQFKVFEYLAKPAKNL